jgi:hypothetical protein
MTIKAWFIGGFAILLSFVSCIAISDLSVFWTLNQRFQPRIDGSRQIVPSMLLEGGLTDHTGA